MKFKTRTTTKRVALIVYFALCILAGRHAIAPVLLTIYIIAMIFFDGKEHSLSYLALYLPWYPVLEIEQATVVVGAFLIRNLIKRKVSTLANINAVFFSAILLLSNIFAGINMIRWIASSVYFIIIVIFLFDKGLTLDYQESIYTFAVSLIMSGIFSLFGNLFPYWVKGSEQVVFYGFNNYFEGLLAGITVRFSGINIDSNFNSANLLITVAFLLFLIYKHKEQKTVKNIFTIILLLTMGMQSLSITYFISLFALITVCAFVDSNRSGKKIIFGGLFIFLIAAVYMIFPQNVNTLINIFLGRLSRNTFITRIDIWKRYFLETISSFNAIIFGHGAMSLIDNSSHNVFVRLFYMNGIICGGLIVILLLKNLINWRQFDNKYFLFFVPIFLFSMTLDLFVDISIYFFMYFLIIINQISKDNVLIEGKV